MSNLEEMVDNFEFITEIAYDLSQRFDGLDTEDRRKKVSTHYLAKVVPECVSLLKLLPWSTFADPSDSLDFSSFCSLCRNVIESSNLHWYYCVDNVGTDEIEFRFLLYDYHYHTTIIRLGGFLGTSSEDLDRLEEKRKSIRVKIEAHPFFNALAEDERRQISKGRKCSHLTQSEISERRGLEMDFFNGIYKLLSNNVHATPSAISTVVHARIHGDELNLAFAGILLTYVPAFAADMVKTIGAMWDLEFAKQESAEIIHQYSDVLYVST